MPNPVNLILLSPRRRKPLPPSNGDLRLVEELARLGHETRWIYPVDRRKEAKRIPGVVAFPVVSPPPAFRKVQDHLLDGAMERELTTEIRRQMPDLVHLLSYGGATSVNLSWTVDRMGAPCLVTVDVKKTLCHRGTLIDDRGQPCTNWSLPERCAACCLQPFPEGLGVTAAAAGRLLSRISSLSPFPTPVDFENRMDLIIGGLQFLALILVNSEKEKDMLQSIGLREGQVQVLSSPSVADLLEVYRDLVEQGVGIRPTSSPAPGRNREDYSRGR